MKTIKEIWKTTKFMALAVLTLAALPLVIAGALWNFDEPFCFCPWVRI